MSDVQKSNSESTLDGRTLRELLDVAPKDLTLRMNNKSLMAAADSDSGQLAQWIARGQSSNFSDQVAEHLCDALNDNLAGVFAGAWSKYTELKKFAKQTREDPTSTMDVALADHDFTHEIDCAVDVLLDGTKVASIPFALTVSCTVSGLELWLKQGCVYQVRSGKMDCEAEIRCAQTVVWTRALTGVNLPGELHLAKPIALDS